MTKKKAAKKARIFVRYKAAGGRIVLRRGGAGRIVKKRAKPKKKTPTK